jgi:hypothetical protein
MEKLRLMPYFFALLCLVLWLIVPAQDTPETAYDEYAPCENTLVFSVTVTRSGSVARFVPLGCFLFRMGRVRELGQHRVHHRNRLVPSHLGVLHHSKSHTSLLNSRTFIHLSSRLARALSQRTQHLAMREQQHSFLKDSVSG